MARQKRTGWMLIVVGVGYHRLFPQGAAVRGRARRSTSKEWFYFIGMLVLIMLGTINVRMAEMRERSQKTHAARSIRNRAIPQMTTRIDQRFADAASAKAAPRW